MDVGQYRMERLFSMILNTLVCSCFAVYLVKIIKIHPSVSIIRNTNRKLRRFRSSNYLILIQVIISKISIFDQLNVHNFLTILHNLNMMSLFNFVDPVILQVS